MSPYQFSPGDYLTKSNRLAQMLIQSPSLNNGTAMGGMADVIRQGMAGYLMSRGQDEADQLRVDKKADELNAQNTMAQAQKAAQGWVDPDTGQRMMPGGGMGKYAQVLMSNPNTADMGHKAYLANMEMDQAAKTRADEREWREAQADKKYGRDLKLANVKAENDFSQELQKLFVKYNLDMNVAAAKPSLDAGMRPPMFGQPPIMSDAPETGGITGQMPGQAPSAMNPPTGALAVPGQAPNQPRTLAEAKAQQAAMTERAKVQAKAQAEAQVGLPQAQQDSQYLIGLLDEIAAPKMDPNGQPMRDEQGNLVPGDVHPGLPDMVGMPAYGGLTKAIPFVGGPIPGTDAANFQTRLDQIGGKQFLQAYQTLKGGGQITEVEGKKAEQALARMNTAQSEEEFIRGVLEFRDEVQRLAGIAQQRAGQTHQPQGIRMWNPATGGFEDQSPAAVGNSGGRY